jgi:hypothetical protein
MQNGPVKRPRRRWRNYIINPAFQWRYAVLVVFGVFLTSLPMTTGLFRILHGQARARLLEPGTSHVWENTLTVLLSGAAFAGVMAAVFGIWSIIVTHRISGPVFVMKRVLADLATGRFPRKRPLRKKDEFKDFYEVLWQAVDAMKAQRQADLAKLREVLEIARADTGADSGTRGLESAAVQIEQLCKQLSAALGESVDGSIGAGASESTRASTTVGTKVKARP